ncbi:MAG: spore germination protein GerW family protein [Thermincola sp.]|nr:spore germination protein GerW family protein [Thermincola sp.]MDT3704164.1 spore germination protein GerW family protein [Thermincola sp.]
MDLKQNLDAIFSHLENMFKAKTVIGEPIEIGEITLVPVVNVTFGIGTAGGEGKDTGEQGAGGIGAGTGARLIPAAVIVIKGDQVSMLPVSGKSSLENIVEMVPEVVAKLKKAVQKVDWDTEQDL